MPIPASRCPHLDDRRPSGFLPCDAIRRGDAQRRTYGRPELRRNARAPLGASPEREDRLSRRNRSISGKRGQPLTRLFACGNQRVKRLLSRSEASDAEEPHAWPSEAERRYSWSSVPDTKVRNGLWVDQ